MPLRVLVAAVAVAAVLAAAPAASAASCNYTGAAGGSWHTAANWSCGEVPGSDDAVTLGGSDDVEVTSAVTVASLTVDGTATLRGTSSVTVTGAFSKTGTERFTVRQSVDVVLQGTGTHSGGEICLTEESAGDPNLRIQATFTIAAGAAQGAYPCGTTAGPRMRVEAPNGHLVVNRPGTTTSAAGLDNDGLLTVQQGRFDLASGSGGATSDGDYVVESGATLVLSNNTLTSIGATGRLGGAGTVEISAVTGSVFGVQMTAGSVLDPAVLKISGGLQLEGTTAQTLAELDLSSQGFFRSSRPVTVTSLDVTQGRLAGTASFTVPAGGSFTKTTGDTLFVRESTDLVLDVDATLAGGAICLTEESGGDPNLRVNRQFTIGAGALQDAFNCGTSAQPRVHVNAPNGHLVVDRPGLTRTLSQIDNDDQLTVQQGTFNFLGGTGSATSTGAYVASAGTTLLWTGIGTTEVGATGRVGGAGTVRVEASNFGAPGLRVAGGGTFDPGLLHVFNGELELAGTSALTLPAVDVENSGIFRSSRPVTITSLDVTAGTFAGSGSFTVPTGGAFTKTTSGQLRLVDSADLALEVDATLAGGLVCVTGTADPRLLIRRTFTVGPGAEAAPFPCGGVATPGIRLDGPDARLAWTGTLASNTKIEVADGILDVPAGRALTMGTEVLSVGGGVLRGGGQITATVTNTGGTVAPGTSPGVLTISGNYTQGPGGTLAVEVAGTTPGTQFDRLVVSGTASLDGTLAVSGGSGFTPGLTDEYEVLTAGSRTGQFASVTGNPVGGRVLSPRYDPDGVTLLVQEAPPANTAPPSLPPSSSAGRTLTCDPGSWTGAPTFAFAWLVDGQVVAGQTGSTYTVASGDAGKTVTCRVTATNGAGSTEATSNGSAVAAPQAPGPGPSTPSTPSTPARPAVTPPVQPGPTVTPPPVATPTFARIVSLPSTRRCVSRRRFRIRLRVPRGVRVTRVEVRVNGRRVAVRRGTRLTAPVDLRNLPRGRFSVAIRLVVAGGRTISGTRRYRTCTPRRGGGRGPRV
jgi:hypothetical protein